MLPIPSLDAVEYDAIRFALWATEGRKPEAAQALGISLKTLYNKLNAYELGGRPIACRYDGKTTGKVRQIIL